MKYYTPTHLSENIHETPEGFLLCIGVPITRTGELIYGEGETPLETDDDGLVSINREEDDVFALETMASFEGKPVTINHPDEFVNPQNWQDLARGVLQNIRRGGGDQKNSMLADLLITDEMAINLVKNGLREVSCGYEAEYIQTAEGKGRQVKIIGNHLALVEKGRAGPSCAINDNKGKEPTTMSKLAELLKKLSKVADEEMPEKKEDKKEDKKESKDMGAYDELVQICNALNEKVSALMEGKKASDEKEMPEKKEEEKSKDAEEEMTPPAESSLEDRLKAVEMAVAKMMEAESKEAETMMGDEDGSEEEESMDADKEDKEEKSITGDTASRVEILSPGLKGGKDIMTKALKAAYATKEGKEVIDSLTAGKPTFDSADKVKTLFIAASEVLKQKRSSEFSKTKQVKDWDHGGSANDVMTPEKMNELNAAHWARK